MTKENIENPAIQRFILVVLLIVGAVFLSFNAVKSGNLMLMGLVVGIPLGIYFLAKPHSLLIWLYLVSATGLSIPGFGSKGIRIIFMAMIIGWWIASSALKKDRPRLYEKSETFLILFVLNIIMIMSIRGFSISMFGGYEVGGGAYIVLLLGLLVYFGASRIGVHERHIKWLLFGPLVFGLIPSVAQLASHSVGAIAPLIDKFFVGNLQRGVQTIGEQDMANVRWTGLGAVASGLLTLGLVLRFPKGKGKYVLPVAMIGIALLIRMTSGFRSSTFGMVVMVMLWCIFMSRNKLATTGLMFATVIAGWLFLMVTIHFFPENMQRSVSFLPFVDVDRMVALNAEHSTLSRLPIWRIAASHINEYLWVGRGMVVDVKGWAFLQASAYKTPEFRYLMHGYHSGPLSLLIDYGLPGFIFGTGFLFYCVREGWKGLSAFSDKQSLVFRFYFLLNIKITYTLFAYFLIFGDVEQSFPAFIMNVVLMRVLRYNFGTKNVAADGSTNPQPRPRPALNQI